MSLKSLFMLCINVFQVFPTLIRCLPGVLDMDLDSISTQACFFGKLVCQLVNQIIGDSAAIFDGY